MAKNTKYEITLELENLEHLFENPGISPFSDKYKVYSYIAGIEFIANELYANPSHDAVKLNLILPPEQITSELASQAKAAVNRYCLGRLKDIEHDLNAVLWRGLRALGLAIVALFLLIGASRLVYDDVSLISQVISEGLAIAAWVGLWVPLDMLVFKVWEHRLDKNIYSQLSKMEISISPLAQLEEL